VRASIPESYRTNVRDIKATIKNVLNHYDNKFKIMKGEEMVNQEILEDILSAIDRQVVIDDRKLNRKQIYQSI